MEYYHRYISERLRQKRAFPTEIEKAIVAAIDCNNAKGCFDLLYFTGSECYHCVCSVHPENGRYQILQLRGLKHTLLDIYASDAINLDTATKYDHAYIVVDGSLYYDPYYDLAFPELQEYNSKLEVAMGELKSLDHRVSTVFLAGEFCYLKAIMYTVQKLIGGCIKVDVPLSLNLKSRFMFSRHITRDPFNISIEKTTVNQYIGSNKLDLYIPIDNRILDSLFWKLITFRDLIPDGCVKCEIGGVECYYLDLTFEIDGFNNVFCKTNDGVGHSSYLLVYSPFGYKEVEISVVEPLHAGQIATAGSSPDTASGEEENLENINIVSPAPVEEEARIDVIEKSIVAIESLSVAPESEDDVPTETDGSKESRETVSIEIKSGEIRSYTDIFIDRYVIGTEEVMIEDSYIYLPHQFQNLRNFIGVINSVLKDNDPSARLKKVKLITCRAQNIVEDKNKEVEKEIKRGKGKKGKKPANSEESKKKVDPVWSQQQQEKNLKRLQKDMKDLDIDFEYSFAPFHDRRILFSNGWTVNTGRGLDIFQKRRNEMEPLRCRDVQIIFTFSTPVQSIQRKVRKL
ncbi:MAG: hypothetical protein K2H60_12425 [Muribaculaceae bacterium]|nr:hypothetical protein [Muribaculaceae bacterium]